MTDNEAMTEGMTFKNQFTRWLFVQGSSTVMLIMITAMLGYGAYVGIPWAMQHFETMQEKQEQAHKQARDDFKEVLSKQNESLEKVTDALDKNTEVIRDLRSAIKQGM